LKVFVLAALVVALGACAPPAAEKAPEPAPAPVGTPAPNLDIPAGAYRLDPAHATLVFRVNHLGFSNYTAQFTKFDATLQFDPAAPAAANVTATVDANSLSLQAPPPGFLAEIKGPNFLDTAKFKDISFQSTKVEATGPNTARITGDFTLHGVTQPLVLDATYNGGWRGIPQDPKARIGFSAHGVIKRAAHGIGYGVPAPGSTMGVSDDVHVQIEAEFSGPPMAADAGAPAEKK
jgi:polyisoprenoid-binding protein YceI